MKQPSQSTLRRMTPDELREEVQVAAAHSDFDYFERCLKLWLDKMGWSMDELHQYIDAKFKAGLH